MKYEMTSQVNELLKVVKQSLSIVQTSTAKDEEIKMWISAAISDMERQGIAVLDNIQDCLVQGAITLYAKSNFGFIDIKEKELAEKSYKQLCNNLSLSSDYKTEVEINA